MIAGSHFEDTLSALLTAAETATTDERFPQGLQLGVQVFPGRSRVSYPPNYVAVVAEDEEVRGQSGVYRVIGSIWCVTSVDEPAGLEMSKALAGKIERWLDPGCPAKGFRNSAAIIHGISKGNGYVASADQSYADVLPVTCGLQVRR